jgi:hypothetical protein
MISYKFAVGDLVHVASDRFSGEVPPGIYTIFRRLPVEANVCHYRVKHVQDSHERAVREDQLTLARPEGTTPSPQAWP